MEQEHKQESREKNEQKQQHETREKSRQERSRKDKNEDLYNQYHPPFREAMIQIFEHDTCKYTYKKEYPINSLSNKFDLMIIKKRRDSVSGKGLGKIFRKYNIFEYKSPGQSLGVREYHIVMAYANLYAGYMKKVQYEELTVSFVREGKPRKLFDYFKEQGFRISMPENGIYYIKRQYHIDMQVIVTRELGDEYIWLKALSDRLTREDAIKLTEEAKKEQEPLGKMRIRTILDLVSELNQNKTWMKEMNTMGIRDLFKEEFEEKDQKIAEQEEQIQNLNEQLQSKDEQLQNQSEQLQSKNKQLQNQNEQLQSKDALLQNQNEQLQSKDALLQNQNEQLQNQNKQLQSEKEEVNRLRKEIEELKKQMGKIAVL